MECEKHQQEKQEIQRHCVMYYEMSYSLNLELHRQVFSFVFSFLPFSSLRNWHYLGLVFIFNSFLSLFTGFISSGIITKFFNQNRFLLSKNFTTLVVPKSLEIHFYSEKLLTIFCISPAFGSRDFISSWFFLPNLNFTYLCTSSLDLFYMLQVFWEIFSCFLELMRQRASIAFCC